MAATATRLKDRTDCENLTDTQRRSHYSSGCRNTLCTAAATAYARTRKSSKKSAAPAQATPAAHEQPAQPKPGSHLTASTGTTRRLQALTVIGVTPHRVAETSGIKPNTVWWLMVQPPARIPRTVHDRIRETFKQLRLTPVTPDPRTPQGQHAAQAVRLAETMGWAGPFDWDDIDADEKPSTRRLHRDADALQSAIDAARIDDPAPDNTADRIADLQHQAEELVRALAEANDARAESLDAIDRLRRANDTLTAQLDDVEANTASTAAQVSDLHMSCSQLTAERDQADTRAAEALAAADEARQEAQRVTGRLELAHADLAAARDRIAALEAAPDAPQAEDAASSSTFSVPTSRSGPVTVTITLGAAL